MKKFAIAILLSAGTLFSVQAQAGPGPVIGAVEGAVVGSHFGGAHGAVAGAIIGTIIGSAAEENYYDRRGRVRYERDYGRYEPAASYYSPPVAYSSYVEPRYESQYAPREVVYVQPPVYASYPYAYASYATPVYYSPGRYAAPRYVSYRGHHGTRHDRYDHRRRY